MKTVRSSSLFLLLSASLLFAACDDATNVGADLVGAQGGQPVLDEIPVSELSPAEIERPATLPPRLLAGAVDDPLLGSYEVLGYADITAVSNADFRAGVVEAAELRLTPTYVYGDTTAEITLAVREITQSWDTDDEPTDTTLTVGPVLFEFTMLPTDTLVVLALPEEWVTEHDELLRSTNFGTEFHGFRFDHVAGNAVVGFGPGATSLFAATAEDSVFMPVGETHPQVERSATGALPPDRLLMQAAAGSITSFSLNVDELPPSAVNRASVTFWADTLLLDQNLPPHFVRPVLRTLDLFGVTNDSAGVLLGRGSLDDEGKLVFQSAALARTLQDRLLDAPSYDRFELRIPDPATLGTNAGDVLHYHNSLNPIILYDAGAAQYAPTTFLTLTPLD